MRIRAPEAPPCHSLRRRSFRHVHVTVEDFNEYQPRFNQSLYHARVSEDLSLVDPSLTSILQISAVDDDCNDQTILYSILHNELSDAILPFEIDLYTGVIRVIDKLDYEKIGTYRFRVKASNLDQITSSVVPVIVDVLDVNDNLPFIQLNILSEYKYQEDADYLMININENIPVGQVLGTASIRDLDSASINQGLTLRILSCLPLTIACPIELDSETKNPSMTSPNYLIRTARPFDSEIGDEKFRILLEARKI